MDHELALLNLLKERKRLNAKIAKLIGKLVEPTKVTRRRRKKGGGRKKEATA